MYLQVNEHDLAISMYVPHSDSIAYKTPISPFSRICLSYHAGKCMSDNLSCCLQCGIQHRYKKNRQYDDMIRLVTKVRSISCSTLM